MIEIQKNILLAPYTTFKIGGPAKYFSEAKSSEEIKELCKWACLRRGYGGQAKKQRVIPILVLGGGSNVLISDKGFNGLVIKIENCKLKIENCAICADAGMPLAKIVAEAAKSDLAGLEWAIGIPGTVGGAICSNSGAFGKSIGDLVESVEVLEINDNKIQNSKFKIKRFENADCEFSYRESIFKKNRNLIILSARLRLKKGDKSRLQEAIKDFTRQRLESNPTGPPAGGSAGCFFKNLGWEEVGNKEKIISEFPELKQFADKPKISAGFLIDYLGLRGKKIGDAAISKKHANFILNLGSAKAKDVLNLANLIKGKIRERYGFDLEEEVCLVGF